MKLASPKYALRKCWINYIDLQQLGLSYTAVGLYVCATTNKLKGFSPEDLALTSNPNTLSEIEYAIQELLEAKLIELASVAVVQGGAA